MTPNNALQADKAVKDARFARFVESLAAERERYADHR
jgi:hypothetical protein